MTDPSEEPSSLESTVSAVDPADVASAGRSCSAILIMVVIILLIVCIGIAARWWLKA